ncbi:MAG: PKD domain-containing protein, partial [bacterium]
MKNRIYQIILSVFMAIQWCAVAQSQEKPKSAEVINLLRIASHHFGAQDSASVFALAVGDTVKISPGSTKSFTETISSIGCGVVTGYNVQKVLPGFMTFTDNGVSQEIIGSKFTIKFDLAVSASASPGFHDIKLTYQFVSGTTFRCSRELTYVVNTDSDVPPTADFTGNPTSGSKPLAVQFTDASTGQITSRSWNFGDGQTSTATSPSHTYANSGSYTVSLTVTGPGGSNTKTRTNYITVTEPLPPVANFSGSPTSGVKPLTVQFTDSSSSQITSRAWNFGDGQTSMATNPSHTYANAGSYTVSLTVTGSGGSNTKTRTNYITVIDPPPPIANFTASPTSGPKPLTVQFNDASTGQITSRAWNFGDGQTSIATNPSHTYINAGTYTVSLTVNGPGGSNTKTQTNYITVSGTPAADFTGAPTAGPKPLVVQFTDKSAGQITSRSWNFGDGQTSMATNPSHTYHNDGTYTVSLTVSGPGGTHTRTRENYIAVREALSLHVSTAGNDANPGTGNAPLRNIQTALNRAGVGDTVKVARGTYSENLSTTTKVVLLGGYDDTFAKPARDIFNNKTIIKPVSGTMLTDAKSSTIDGFIFDGGGGANKAIAITAGHAIITHNIIHRFFQSFAVGIDVPAGVSAAIKNNTIINNMLSGGGTINYALYLRGNAGNATVVQNNIVSKNDVGIYIAPAGVQANYNCVFGSRYKNYDGANGVAGGNDIAADPQFMDALNGDFRLKTTSLASPCIDAGNPADPVGDEPQPNSRIDIGAYGGTRNAPTSQEAAIGLNPSTFQFTAALGGNNPPSQTLSLQNTGASGSTLNWSAAVNASWLTVSPAGGSLASRVSQNVTLSINIANLAVGAHNATVTISDPNANNSPQTATVKLTIISRLIRVVNTSASPGSTVNVPIELVAQGDENALGFSLAFDTSILSNPQAVRGKDAGAATLNTNSSQTNSGRYGLALALPTGQQFAAGTREIVVVTFSVNTTISADSTTLGFGDQPIAREVVDVNANALLTSWIPGKVRIARGYEADVAPRPNGSNNGSVTTADWVQVGRFAAALDQPRSEVNEFQRADCAPRPCGDGRITTADWVQAGRYAAGLDPVAPACGPLSVTSSITSVTNTDLIIAEGLSKSTVTRTVRVVNATVKHGQMDSIIVALE